MKIIKHRKIDLFLNGNFVESFDSDEDLKIYFENEFDVIRRNWWLNDENEVIREMNKKKYSVIRSEYITFEKQDEGSEKTT